MILDASLIADGWNLTEEQIKRLDEVGKTSKNHSYWHQDEKPCLTDIYLTPIKSSNDEKEKHDYFVGIWNNLIQ